MMPTYNAKAKYLEQALQSVLAQDPGADRMQIKVIDDCSPNVDVEKIIKSIASNRIQFFRSPKNLGLTGSWNACIEHAHGEWVHIFHQDDLVLPGFYQKLEIAASSHPDLNLLATRAFFVDNEGVIIGLTQRIKELENGGRTVEPFFYNTPVQCPGIVVKRSFYKEHGGFLPLASGLDCEMWARVISTGGGMLLPDILACFRSHPGSETGRLHRTAEILHDLARTNEVFAKRYPEFDMEKGRNRVLKEALKLAKYFTEKGDVDAAQKNLDYWNSHAPLKLKFRRTARNLARQILATGDDTN